MTVLDIDRTSLAELCRRHRIRRLALFGSQLSGRTTSASDVDLLVEFEPGHVPGFAFAAIERELSELFGKPVDLRLPGDLNERFRDDVCRKAEAIYVAE